MFLKKSILGIGKSVLLVVLFLIAFSGGIIFITGLPNTPAEPGPIPSPFDLLVVVGAHVLVLSLLITNSRWYGWRLAAAVAFAYYGCVTFLGQIETWYFLTSINVSQETLRGLFLAGLPTALVFVPLAVWILGKWRASKEVEEPGRITGMPASQWIWKLAIMVVAWQVLYFSAGYFIAWQNPVVRAFYGGKELGSFWSIIGNNIQVYPGIFPLQAMRALLWVVFTLPVIRMSKGSPWRVALLVALLYSVPMNIGHILGNPLMPNASMRMSHLVETASSTFVFGLIVTWLLHRQHVSLPDLFGFRREKKAQVLPQPQAS